MSNNDLLGSPELPPSSQLASAPQDIAMADDEAPTATRATVPNKKRKYRTPTPSPTPSPPSATPLVDLENRSTTASVTRENLDGGDLHDVTILGVPSSTDNQDTPAAAGSLWSMFKSGPSARIVEKIELNNCGDVFVQIRTRHVKYQSQAKDTFPIIEVRCSLNTIRDLVSNSIHTVSRFKWLDMFPDHRGGKRTVLMPAEDDEFALLFVLRIAHGNQANIPQVLKFKHALKLAVLCHKYGIGGETRNALIQRIQPLLEYDELTERVNILKEQDGEVSDADKDLLESAETRWFTKEGKEEWLFVASTFGFAHSFKLLLDHLVRTCKLVLNQELYTVSGPLRGRFPTEALKYIAAMRKHLLDKLLTVTYDYIKSFIKDGADASSSDRGGLTTNRKYRNAVHMCGTFVIHLAKEGLGPQQPSVDSRKVQRFSVSKLERHLKMIEGPAESDDEVKEGDSGIPGVQRATEPVMNDDDEDDEEQISSWYGSTNDGKVFQKHSGKIKLLIINTDDESIASGSDRARMYWHQSINQVLNDQDGLPKHFAVYLAQQAKN
ncbi:hypothetical protein P154DRAFT_353124 [Amniculicola lignicola CBS 123094]|uniref:Uncharacterized protein n=1 Tax=Amniculicola lignicola CBS 123094 TaxID=1392246 RepID=A0A6A5X294_9PLEO|nr:hypothetical protein P154DRAFT_353124 [Amniculicola lignicola CBS 123094]